MRARRPGGFTLIELMVVVAIVGILSSIAVPAFGKLQLRSRQAERAVITSAIERASDEYFSRDGHYPTANAGTIHSYLSLPYNPGYPARPYKRPINVNLGDWNKLNLQIVGNVYYTYYAYGYEYDPGYFLGTNDTRYFYTLAYGDLDGDGYTGCYWYHQRFWAGAGLVNDTMDDASRWPGASWGCF